VGPARHLRHAHRRRVARHDARAVRRARPALGRGRTRLLPGADLDRRRRQRDQVPGQRLARSRVRAGFGAGTLVGISIENALAYGVATVRVVSRDGGGEIALALRERGYGVTEIDGQGRDGRVEILNSVVQRQDLEEVMRIVDRWDPGAFVTVEEPKMMRGGSVARRVGMAIPWRRRAQRGA
jgi:hypothetical protein